MVYPVTGYPLPGEVAETAPLWRRRCADLARALRRVGLRRGGADGTWVAATGAAMRAVRRGDRVGSDALLSARAGEGVGFRPVSGTQNHLGVVVGLHESRCMLVDPEAAAVARLLLPTGAAPGLVAHALDLLGDDLPAAAVLAGFGPAAFAPVYDIVTAKLPRQLPPDAEAETLRFRPAYRRELIEAGYAASTRGW